MLTEIHSYWLIEHNLNLTYPTIFTKNLVHGLRFLKKGFAAWFIFTYYKCIKDLPSNAAQEGSKNLEKFTFGLPQKSNTYCTVKVYKNRCNKTLL